MSFKKPKYISKPEEWQTEQTAKAQQTIDFSKMFARGRAAAATGAMARSLTNPIATSRLGVLTPGRVIKKSLTRG